MDFDEEDDEEIPVNNHHRHQLIDESNGITGNNEDGHGNLNKNQPYSISMNNKTKTTTKLSLQDNNNNLNDQKTGVEQQDEWEEFEDSKYDQIRLKFSRNTNDDDEYYDDDDYDENNHHTNLDDNTNNINNGGNDDESSRNNRRQQKDKPVWKLDQVKQIETNDLPIEKVEEVQVQPQPAPPKSATTAAYRPPQLRGNSSVTIVSGIHHRISKKEKPNLASTEEFPTLGAAVNKK